MRSLFVILALHFNLLSSGQTMTPINENTSVIIIPKIMKEKEIRLIMKEKNNSEIDKLVAKSKLFKNFRAVGFAAIPAGLLSGVLLFSQNQRNNDGVPGNNITKVTGISLLALGTVCLSSSVYFDLAYKKNYKKAIQKYNALYN